MEITHASDRRGTKTCGSTTSGDGRANVELHPEKITDVTCAACLESLAAKTDGGTKR